MEQGRYRPIRRAPADRQQERAVGLCSVCRGELYRGDPVWRVEGELVCEDCLPGFARRYFAPWQVWGGELLEREEADRYHDLSRTVGGISGPCRGAEGAPGGARSGPGGPQ